MESFLFPIISIISVYISQVLRLRIKNGHVTSVQEVYGDDGHRIQGSSSAVRHLDGLLIGTITHKAAYCKITTLAI